VHGALLVITLVNTTSLPLEIQWPRRVSDRKAAGVLCERTGSCGLAWWIAVAVTLGLAALAANLPINERPLRAAVSA
jgi:hypothetical protein